uniref:Triadin n=1 Tax=Stegastes partitus TaxID=144197 RepID=A0A3B5BM48_9TELE
DTPGVQPRSSTTTTMVIESKNGDAGSPPSRVSKKSFKEDVYSTFSSPLAWILVLALVITWSCVFVIMFDLMDYKTISGRPSPGIRKVLKDSGRRGGISRIGSDPMKAVNDAVEESSNVISMVFRFAANLIAPEEDEGTLRNSTRAEKKRKTQCIHETACCFLCEGNTKVQSPFTHFLLSFFRKSICSEEKRFVLMQL